MHALHYCQRLRNVRCWVYDLIDLLCTPFATVSPWGGNRLVAVPYQSFDAVGVIVGGMDVGMASTFWWPYIPRNMQEGQMGVVHSQ